MNEDEIKSAAVTVAAVLAPIAAKYGIDADTLTQVASGLVVVAFGVYMHWNMKKVPETAVVK